MFFSNGISLNVMSWTRQARKSKVYYYAITLRHTTCCSNILASLKNVENLRALRQKNIFSRQIRNKKEIKKHVCIMLGIWIKYSAKSVRHSDYGNLLHTFPWDQTQHVENMRLYLYTYNVGVFQYLLSTCVVRKVMKKQW